MAQQILIYDNRNLQKSFLTFLFMVEFEIKCAKNIQTCNHLSDLDFFTSQSHVHFGLLQPSLQAVQTSGRPLKPGCSWYKQKIEYESQTGQKIQKDVTFGSARLTFSLMLTKTDNASRSTSLQMRLVRISFIRIHSCIFRTLNNVRILR